MNKSTRYSPEVRDRAVRLVFEHQGEHASQWAALISIASKIGCTPETLRKWVRRAETDRRSARAKRDDALKLEIQRVWDDNFRVYGIRKVWRQLKREGFEVARCTVARLMQDLGLRGVVRGRKVKTTVPDELLDRPLDRVNRQFNVVRPNALWVADLTYVATWRGFVYVAFVIDAFARRIVGWRVPNSLRTGLALDALEQALYDRQKSDTEELIHHSDRGVQGEFKRSSQHLNEEDMRWPYVDNRREGVLFDHQCARPADRRYLVVSIDTDSGVSAYSGEVEH